MPAAGGADRTIGGNAKTGSVGIPSTRQPGQAGGPSLGAQPRVNPQITRTPTAGMNRDSRAISPTPSPSLSRSAPSLNRSDVNVARGPGSGGPGHGGGPGGVGPGGPGHGGPGGGGPAGGLRPVGITRSYGSTGISWSRYPAPYAPAARGYPGPRFGVPGYSSCFTRYTPYYYRPAYCGPVAPYYGRGYFYPYHYHHSSFAVGFGFYGSCFSYSTYPLVYYPTYYAPLYPVYPSTVVVTEPVVQYYPATTTVVTPQYVSADAYAAGTTVAQPEVTYAEQGAAVAAQAAQEAPTQDAQPAPQAAEQVPAQGYTQPQYGQPQYGQQAPSYSPPGATEMQAPGASAQDGGGSTAAPAPIYSQPQVTEPQGSGTVAPPTTPSATVPQPSSSVPQPSASAAPGAAQPESVAPGQAAPAENPGVEAPAAPAPGAEPQPTLSPEKLQELMMAGTQAFTEARYADAAAKFGEVTQADPQNVDAALAHAVARFATGEYTPAANSIRQGISLFPPIVDSVFDLRERYQKTGDFITQSKRLEDYLNKSPNDVDARLVLGFVRHFSNQRDLARRTFEGLKKGSPNDASLADAFLNALTPEQARAQEQAATGQQQGQVTTAPAAGDTGKPGALSVTVSTQPAGIVTSQPADLEAIRGGQPNPGVLAVTSRPAQPPQAVELPKEPLFRGKLSLTSKDLPREQTTVDGITVVLKGTDDDPLQASLEIMADRRMKVRRFQPGAKVENIKGTSGQVYRLFLVEVDNKTETIGYVIAR
jgi:tetratricopeptide (TPR) repeat protein